MLNPYFYPCLKSLLQPTHTHMHTSVYVRIECPLFAHVCSKSPASSLSTYESVRTYKRTFHSHFGAFSSNANACVCVCVYVCVISLIAFEKGSARAFILARKGT